MGGEDEDDTPNPEINIDLVRLFNAGHSLEDLRLLARNPTPPGPGMQILQQPIRKLEKHADDSEGSMSRESPTTTETDWTSDDETSIRYTDKGLGPPHHNARLYHKYPKSRRPLIDLVRNDWRTNQKYRQSYSPTSDAGSWSGDPPTWTQLLTAPKLRRSMFLVLSMVILFWGNWEWWLRQAWEEHLTLRGALDERMRTGEGWFGTNMRLAFADMIQVQTLDTCLVPRGDKGRRRNRLIVVGDVHGCRDELLSLLSKVSYRAGFDHLVLAGDIVSKGPLSSAVVDLAMSMNASCVRGNHEDRVLLVHRDMTSHHLSLPGPHEDILQPGIRDHLDEESFSHGDYLDRRLANSLSQKQIDYLAACPVILRIGEIKGMGQVAVAHAGLVPGVDLERQDPLAVMTMRTIDLNTHVPSRQADGVPWSKLWNKYQTLLPRHLRSTVLYGHDSRRGLSLKKYSKGLDSGCVRGGKLSAMVIEDGGRWRNAKTRVVSVKCRDYRPRKMDMGGLDKLGQS